MDIDNSTWLDKAKSRNGWRSLFRPKQGQSFSRQQIADDDCVLVQHCRAKAAELLIDSNFGL